MRDAAPPPQWAGRVHRWPFDPLAGKYTDAVENFRGKQPVHQGVLRRIESRWGTFWQGDFTEFTQPGIFQIETEQQITVPFAIGPAPYGRLLRGYLTMRQGARGGLQPLVPVCLRASGGHGFHGSARAEGANCLTLAQRAWQYAQSRRHDQRTLFLCASFMPRWSCQAGSRLVSPRDVFELAEALQGRQDSGRRGTSALLPGKD